MHRSHLSPFRSRPSPALPAAARRVAIPTPLAVLLAACMGGSFLSVSVGYGIDEQRVMGSPLGGLLGPAADVPIPITVDLAAESAARDTGPAQHVYLTSLTLDITTTAEPAGDSDDFGFLGRADLYIASTRSGSTLPRVRVASLESVPAGARSVAFTVEPVDIIEYAREGARLETRASGTVPPDDVTFDGHYELAIDFLP